MLIMIYLFYVVEPFHDSIQSKVRGSNPTPSNTIATKKNLQRGCEFSHLQVVDVSLAYCNVQIPHR